MFFLKYEGLVWTETQTLVKIMWNTQPVRLMKGQQSRLYQYSSGNILTAL